MVEGVTARTERVTSEDNLLADWLSRSRLEAVLRVARDCGYVTRRVELLAEERSLGHLPASIAGGAGSVGGATGAEERVTSTAIDARRVSRRRDAVGCEHRQ